MKQSIESEPIRDCWNNPIIRWDPTGNEGINVGLPLQAGYSYFETPVSEYLNPSPPIEIEDSYTSVNVGIKIDIERPVITDEERQAYIEQAKQDRQIEYQKQVEVREMMQSSAWKTIAVAGIGTGLAFVPEAAPAISVGLTDAGIAADSVATYYASKYGPWVLKQYNDIRSSLNSPPSATGIPGGKIGRGITIGNVLKSIYNSKASTVQNAFNSAGGGLAGAKAAQAAAISSGIW